MACIEGCVLPPDFFSTLSRTESSFLSFENAESNESVHINNGSGALLAGMLPLSEGVGGTPSGTLSGTESPEKTSEPIGSLADYQLSTPSFRRIRPQEWEEWQNVMGCPASPKKRKVDQATDLGTHHEMLVRLLEDTMASMLRASAAPVPAAASLDHAQTIHNEVKNYMSEKKIELTQLVNTMMEKMQAEANRRADAMLQTLVQMLKNAPATGNDKAASFVEPDTAQEHRTRDPASRGQQ